MAIVSEAFAPFLSESAPHDRREAIVIYRTPDSAATLRGKQKKRMSLNQKKKYLKELASLQAPAYAKSLNDYKKAGKTRLPKRDKADLVTGTIGPMAGALPFAHVQVTRRTLAMLKKADDVLAVIPNQSIKLIKPRVIDYDTLNRSEDTAGMTWGLERLEIPKMWNTAGTKGSNIRVAVLDTGVYDQHPALIGKVKDFVVVDPLGNRVSTAARFDAGNHGTHVCGTVVGGQNPNGVNIGVAPDAELLGGAVLIGDATLRTLKVAE